MSDKILCSGCGKRVAWDKTHTCVGWNGELEESILPWWVDTMKDQLAEDPRSNRGGGASNQIPWWYYLVILLAIIAAAVYLW